MASGIILGTETTFNADDQGASFDLETDIAELDINRFVIMYSQTTDNKFCQIGTVSGDAINWASPFQWRTSNPGETRIAPLSPSGFVIVYTNDASVGRLTFKMAETSGTQIFYGSDNIANPSDSDHMSTFGLDENHFIYAYESGLNGPGILAMSTISGVGVGAEFDFGIGKQIRAGGFPESAMSILNYDTDLVSGNLVLVYRGNTEIDGGFGRIATFSGNTILGFGPETQFSTERAPTDESLGLTIFDDNQNIGISYRLETDASGVVQLGNISGTTINWGEPQAFAASIGGHTNIRSISGNLFSLTYQDNGTNFFGQVTSGAADFGDQTVDLCNIVEWEGVNQGETTNQKINPSAIFVAYRDSADSHHGNSRVIAFEFSDLFIVLGTTIRQFDTFDFIDII